MYSDRLGKDIFRLNLNLVTGKFWRVQLVTFVTFALEEFICSYRKTPMEINFVY